MAHYKVSKRPLCLRRNDVIVKTLEYAVRPL